MPRFSSKERALSPRELYQHCWGRGDTGEGRREEEACRTSFAAAHSHFPLGPWCWGSCMWEVGSLPRPLPQLHLRSTVPCPAATTLCATRVLQSWSGCLGCQLCCTRLPVIKTGGSYQELTFRKFWGGDGVGSQRYGAHSGLSHCLGSFLGSQLLNF